MKTRPNFSQRIRLYLKPISGIGTNWLLFGLLLDTALSWAFFGVLINYVFTGKFVEGTDKTMLLLIGPAFTGTFLIYSIFDAIRYLPYWTDKFLYVLSCAL